MRHHTASIWCGGGSAGNELYAQAGSGCFAFVALRGSVAGDGALLFGGGAHRSGGIVGYVAGLLCL